MGNFALIRPDNGRIVFVQRKHAWDIAGRARLGECLRVSHADVIRVGGADDANRNRSSAIEVNIRVSIGSLLVRTDLSNRQPSAEVKRPAKKDLGRARAIFNTS